ncbi:MAG: ASPIC/UnbV domain-containing protein [Pirellulales bacterium]
MVRTDEELSNAFRENEAWGSKKEDQDAGKVVSEGPDGKRILQSFSGHERNHLFLNIDGKRFEDISALSGLDNDADGRAFAVWDFDHDGWQDVALVNSNRPQLNLYRNEIGERVPQQHSIAIRLVGGNITAEATREWSNRDAYGAEITVACGENKYVRELRCGEGFAAQNSATMIVGLGSAQQADVIEVRWPSGKLQTLNSIPAGKLLTIYENPANAPISSGKSHVIKSYTPATVTSAKTDRYAGLNIDLTSDQLLPARENGYRVYVTTATWCAACKTSLPQIARLRRTFGDDIQFYGIPVDPEDDAAKLSDYVSQFQPAYQLLMDLDDQDKNSVAKIARKLLGQEALPTVLVTDAQGQLVGAYAGVPSVSWLAEIMMSRR